MPERIEVQFSELSDSAAVLRAAADGIVACSAQVRGMSGTGGATGSAACAAFFESMVGVWSDQLAFSAEQVDSLSGATESARGGYETNETATGGMFGAGVQE